MKRTKWTKNHAEARSIIAGQISSFIQHNCMTYSYWEIYGKLAGLMYCDALRPKQFERMAAALRSITEALERR